jgi:hypothetical protein
MTAFAFCLLLAIAPSWKRTLDENFDGAELNPGIWNIETGRRRDAMNAASAVDLKDGKLVITTDTDTKCPGSKVPEFLLFTSESNIKAWNGERPKEGCGAKDKSANVFEVDWVKAWKRIPTSK